MYVRPMGISHQETGFCRSWATFSWPDQRLSASLVGLGNVPWGVLTSFNSTYANSEPPYAVVGLGAGTLAAHARPMQHLVFYEIDPLVKELSLPSSTGKPAAFP